MNETPRYIKVNASDNVAIVVNTVGAAAGTAFPDGLVAKDAIPQAHKIALEDL